jgi:hypothetical protein
MLTQQWEVETDEVDEVDFDNSESTAESSEEEKFEPQEQELRGFAGRFQGDVRGLVRGYMEQFFKDKMLHCGGKIPANLLFAERRISLVLNYDINRGVERAYCYLEPHFKDDEFGEKKKRTDPSGEVSGDIKLVLETLNLLHRSCIPQQFAGGMLLLYLEFVEGFDIGTHP